MKKTILCYGDSNTWGYTPVTGKRYDENTRWTGKLQKALEEDYRVAECGMNARTTSFDDPFRDYLNGRKGLVYALMENKPVDILIISLGTNDLKFGNALFSSFGLDALLNEAEFANERFAGSSKIYSPGHRIIVVSPILLHPSLDKPGVDRTVAGKYKESLRFAELFQPIAEKHGAEFIDAAKIASPSEEDGVHMTAEGHRQLFEAIYKQITGGAVL